MSLKLLRQGLGKRPPRMWHERPLKDQYHVVIIGGGAHGLACAYYLARRERINVRFPDWQKDTVRELRELLAEKLGI